MSLKNKIPSPNKVVIARTGGNTTLSTYKTENYNYRPDGVLFDCGAIVSSSNSYSQRNDFRTRRRACRVSSPMPISIRIILRIIHGSCRRPFFRLFPYDSPYTTTIRFERILKRFGKRNKSIEKCLLFV